MKHLIRLVTGAVLSVLAVSLGVAGLAGATVDPRAPARERHVIVEVTGDAANGFGLIYAGGGSSYPPTDSEARAECSEHNTRVARVRCRVGVRTWYRDLGDLQRSLAHVREQAR